MTSAQPQPTPRTPAVARSADVQLVRRLVERFVHPSAVPAQRLFVAPAANPRTAVHPPIGLRGFGRWPLLILLCAVSAAVGVAVLRAALTGPIGAFWWAGLVLAFFLGHRWERAQSRARVRAEAARVRTRVEARAQALFEDARSVPRG